MKKTPQTPSLLSDPPSFEPVDLTFATKLHEFLAKESMGKAGKWLYANSHVLTVETIGFIYAAIIPEAREEPAFSQIINIIVEKGKEIFMEKLAEIKEKQKK